MAKGETAVSGGKKDPTKKENAGTAKTAVKKAAKKEVEKHDIAIIMSGEHFSINVTEKGHPYDLTDGDFDGYFAADSRFQILELDDAVLDDDDEGIRYDQIVNAGGCGSESSSEEDGWSSSVKRKKVKPQISQGEDVASLSTMGLENDCEYDIYWDCGVPEYVCELTIEGKFDRKKLVVTVGKLYLPDAENADEDGHINVIRSVQYDGEELRFWCSEWVGMPDNGWDTEDEWHYVVKKGTVKKVEE